MRTQKPSILILFALVSLLLIAVGCGTGDSGGNEASLGTQDDPAPSPNAFHHTGPIEGGAYVLPNGRRITPAGDFAWVPRFPNDVQVTPDGQRVIVTTIGSNSVRMLDSLTLEQTQDFYPKFTFAGILFKDAGDRFWISEGGNHFVREYTYAGGTATAVRSIRLFGFPTNMALSADEQTLYVCMHMGRRVAEVNLTTGLEVRSAITPNYPFDIRIPEGSGKLYVTNYGDESVSIISVDSMTETGRITVGKNPSRMAMSPDGSRLYTADADTDTITVIDTDSDSVDETWPLHDDAVMGEVKIGSFPDDIDISADGSRLYIASGGFNCITVMDAGNGEIIGRIPTGWFTSGVSLDDENGVLYAVNGKGFGSGSALPYGWRGTVQAIDLPDEDQLAEYTTQVEQNNAWGHSFFDTEDPDFESPIPTEFGKASEQIKHVIFVLKENKTYDQIFGDLEGTERDPGHLVFGEPITPNHHNLARDFTVFDNFYVEGDTSVIGHFWATALQTNEFAEKAYFASNQKYPISTFEPASSPADDNYLWNTLLDNDVDFRIYGQAVGVTHDLDTLMPHIDLKYGFWNMGTLDVDKVDEFIREVDAGVYPPLVYMSLPNDHNYGSSSGAPTADFLVGDNDAALGKLVDYISHSEHWEDTAIFITQDDPQSGSDHIDKHRTIMLVASPWAKRGHVSSVLHTMSSIWLTIDLILGIPPTTKFDQYTAPMYDAFTMTPDYTPYDGVPNPIPFEINAKDLPYQDYCDKQTFMVPDQVGGMGKVYWALKRPGEPFPYEFSVDIEDEEEEKEEAEEALAYMQALKDISAYAKAHGLEEADKIPFWQNPAIMQRLKLHNEKMKATGTGGY